MQKLVVLKLLLKIKEVLNFEIINLKLVTFKIETQALNLKVKHELSLTVKLENG